MRNFKEKRYTKLDKSNGRYDVYLSGFFPMYCGTFDTKPEAQKYIKDRRKEEKSIK